MAKSPVDGVAVYGNGIFLGIGVPKQFVGLSVADKTLIGDRTERKYQRCFHIII